jgi:putative endopeptidase
VRPTPTRIVAALALLLPAPASLASAAAPPVDVRALDRSARPQDDLFRFVNGIWLERADVPPDRVAHGTFSELADEADLAVRAIVEEAASRRRLAPEQRQIVDLHASMLDETRVEALGAKPIEGQLARLAGVRSVAEFSAEAGSLSALAACGPFVGTLGADASGEAGLVVTLAPAGTLLADPEHYFGEGAPAAAVRSEYARYLTTVFAASGWSRPAAARSVLDIERRLVRAREAAAAARRPPARFTLRELRARIPGFDWAAWAKPQGIERAAYLLLSEPEYFERFAASVGQDDLESWKSWLTARYLTAVAPFLSRPFSEARFEFFGRALTGQQQPIPRWKRAVSLVNGYLADVVGPLYVRREFSAATKAAAERMVGRVLDAYRAAVRDAEWMAEPTRREALHKLARLRARVGYPDTWRRYRGLAIRDDDLLGNVQRAQRFESERQAARVSGAGDPGEWMIPAQVPNAYYAPARNEIVVTAALLRPPLFDDGVDAAWNYGSLGAVIAHEITHALDEQGRGTDGDGAPRDWWKPEDVRAFRDRAALLAAQFEARLPAAARAAASARMLRENVADLAGLSVAFRAYTQSLGGRPAPVIDGFTGEQRFFLSWARLWRGKVRDEHLGQWLLTSNHAPPPQRANVPLGNIQGFYAAFGVEPGSRLYVSPEQRVSIF